jgi:hypothetical protein
MAKYWKDRDSAASRIGRWWKNRILLRDQRQQQVIICDITPESPILGGFMVRAAVLHEMSCVNDERKAIVCFDKKKLGQLVLVNSVGNRFQRMFGDCKERPAS